MAPGLRGLRKGARSREPPPPDDWPRTTVELDERSHEGFVERYPLAAIEFWAPWCAPCKAMRPVIRALAEVHRGRVAFGKVNIDRHRGLAERHGVKSVPFIVFFNYGKRVDELTGSISKRRLEGRLGKLLGKYSR